MKSKVFDAKELRWSFDDDAHPHLALKVGDYPERVKVDPFPCYAHDKAIVKKELEKVVDKSWDLGTKVFIGHYEGLARSNAFASEGHRYGKYIEADKKYEYEHLPFIFLQGKRIPPHPAVTRYLIAHEYGHNVDSWLGRVLGYDTDISGLREDYRKLRGIKRQPSHYGGGTWHKCVGEIFACDFRILVCESELEYWPHEGIPYPDEDSPVAEWWEHVLSHINADKKMHIVKPGEL